MIVSLQWSEVGNPDCCQRDEDIYIRSYRAIGIILLVSGMTEVAMIFWGGIMLVAL